jgi:hypothetical protein
MSSSGTFLLGNYDWSGGTLEARWWVSDRTDNKSDVRVELWGHTNGSWTTYGDGAYFTFRIAGNDYGWTGSVNVSGSWKKLGSASATVGHDAAGALNGLDLGVLAGEVPGTSFNSIAYVEANLVRVNATDYAVKPYAPINLSIRAGSVTPTSFGVDYSRRSYDSVDKDEAQWATDSAFANVVWDDTPPNGNPTGYTNPSGGTPPVALAPGTKHYVRVRSHTAAGWGEWSVTVSQTTLPSSAPGMTVSPTPGGTSARLYFSPPGGATGGSGYTWERRVKGGTEVISDDLALSGDVVNGLDPGTTYEWRGAAWFGQTYLSPWTAWLTVTQPDPNTSPGDYFDGDTADKPGIDYGWTGTPGLSPSEAVGASVSGWMAGFTAPAVGILHQSGGGRTGTFAARVLIQIDSTAAGQVNAGMSAAFGADVVEGATYYGSVYANPSRDQRVRAEVRWYDAADALVGTSPGAEVVLGKNTWTRLTTTGTAPVGAVHGSVRVIDVAGTGWAAWRSGDALLLDNAMVSLNTLYPYFDGSTADTADYDYAWESTAHASISSRTTLENASAFDPLQDPDCTPVPLPPRPPVVPADCIDEIGIWQRYWVSVSAQYVSDWLAVIPTITIQSGRGSLPPDPPLGVNQVRVRIYENPDSLDPDEFAGTEWVSEQIISYMPPFTIITLDGVSQRVWAQVGGEGIDPATVPMRSADHLIYGSGGTPATWPVLSCGLPYLIAFDAPLDTLVGNLVNDIGLTERAG